MKRLVMICVIISVAFACFANEVLASPSALGETADNGVWEWISDPNPDEPTDFVIDPTNSNHLIITTFFGPLKQSWDGGNAWEDVIFPGNYASDNSLATYIYWINDSCYVNSWGKIYKTKDFKNFEKIIDLGHETIDSFATPDEITFYVGLRAGDSNNGKTFLKSSDGGKTWQNLSSGILQAFNEDSSRWLLFGSSGKIIVFKDKVLITAGVGGANKGGNLISYDGGLTFRILNSFSSGVIIPVGDYLFGVVDAQKLYRSNDGLNWEMITDKGNFDRFFGYSGFGVNLEYDKNTGIMYTVNRESGVYYSQDGGKTWIPYNQGFSEEDFYQQVHLTRMTGRSIVRVCGDKLYLLFNTYFYKNTVPTKKAVVMQFQIGDKEYLVNGQTILMETPPVVRNNRTFLPIRYVAEPLGAKVNWNSKERKVTITLKETTIQLWIGKNIAKVNGIDTPIDPDDNKVVPYISNGRTMLPLRFVTENLGCQVQWDGTTKTITITYPKS